MFIQDQSLLSLTTVRKLKFTIKLFIFLYSWGQKEMICHPCPAQRPPSLAYSWLIIPGQSKRNTQSSNLLTGKPSCRAKPERSKSATAYCLQAFWNFPVFSYVLENNKDAMSSVPASSRTTALVQRTVLLVAYVGEPEAYTKLTTRN